MSCESAYVALQDEFALYKSMIKIVQWGERHRHNLLLEKMKRQRDKLRKAVPSNWLDPLLSGPKAVVHQAPQDEIERLLDAVWERIENILKED